MMILEIFRPVFWVKKGIVLGLLVTVVSACGFHMRRAVDLPEGLNTVYVNGFPPGSLFPSYLDQNMKLSEGQVIYDRGAAGFVLNAMSEQFKRREVSLSDTGKANVYELTYILTFDVQTPTGEVILNPQTIQVVRDYFNPQINVIGKSEEEGVIRNEMYREAVRTLLRRTEIALRNYASVP